eukprot:GAHX01001443.1.p1 GENE.GAHX01001443.1~~GAHX01001443.1.p1  ORF type:complete len:389 (-),score=79.05 GAHX01001443.1:28-1194(-)
MEKSNTQTMDVINTLQSTDRLNIVSRCLDILKEIKINSVTNLNQHITEISAWAKKTNKQLLYHQLTFFRADFITNLYYNNPIETREISNTLKQQYTLHALEKELNSLILYFKKKDNKRFLIKAYLYLSKLNLVQNKMSQARSYLTAARATASVGFIPKQLQYQLDYYSGIVYLAVQEVNMAGNYFFECIDAMPNIENVKFYVLSQTINMNFVEVKKTLNKHSGIISGNIAVFEVYAKLSNSIIENNLGKFSNCFHNDILKNREETFEDDLVVNIVKSLFDSVLDRNIMKEVNFYNKVRLFDLEQVVGVEAEVIKGRLEYFIKNKILDGIIVKENNQLVLVNNITNHENYCENVIKESKCLMDYLEEVIKKNNEYFHYSSAKSYIEESK